jgi:hypothetical protein
MPKKIELFEQSAMPNNDVASLQKAVNDWLTANPDADNVEIQMGGQEGNMMIMVYYKTVT